MVYGSDKPTKIIETDKKELDNFCITEKEVLTLASWAVEIEKHYTERAGKWTPMDMEWAKDGESGQLFIVQARPETIHSERDMNKIHEYVRVGESKVIVKAASVGNKIATGAARVILFPTDAPFTI